MVALQRPGSNGARAYHDADGGPAAPTMTILSPMPSTFLTRGGHWTSPVVEQGGKEMC